MAEPSLSSSSPTPASASAASRRDQVAMLTGLTRELRGTILEMIIEAASGHPGGNSLPIASMPKLPTGPKAKKWPSPPGSSVRASTVLQRCCGPPKAPQPPPILRG